MARRRHAVAVAAAETALPKLGSEAGQERSHLHIPTTVAIVIRQFLLMNLPPPCNQHCTAGAAAAVMLGAASRVKLAVADQCYAFESYRCWSVS